MGEAVDEGAEEIDLSGIGHACGGESLASDVVELESERVGGGRRLEAGDRSLEQQLVAYHVLGREPHQRLDELDERFAWVVVQGEGPHEVEELPVAVGEHQIVQAELRVEIGVEGRLTQVDALRQVSQRDGGQAITMSQRPRLGQDRRPLRFPTASSSINLVVRLAGRHVAP